MRSTQFLNNRTAEAHYCITFFIFVARDWIIFMFGISTALSLLLIFCIFCALVFEFINGFHDTANAVATVIYTHSLKPQVAVIWSGFWNFVGVNVGGIAVAIGIINLLPTEAPHG